MFQYVFLAPRLLEVYRVSSGYALTYLTELVEGMVIRLRGCLVEWKFPASLGFFFLGAPLVSTQPNKDCKAVACSCVVADGSLGARRMQS